MDLKKINVMAHPSSLFRGSRIYQLFLAVALCAFVTGQPAVSAEVGEVASESINVGGTAIALPEGKWTTYYSVDDNSGPFPTSKLGLVLVRGKVITQAMYIRVARSPGRAGFKPYPYCERSSYFFAQTTMNQAGNDQDCWHMRAESLAADDTPSDRYQALLNYSKSNGYFLPLTMIGPRYHMADRSKAVRVSIGWNPDIIVRAPKEQKVWRFQDWTAEEIASDPRKRVIMGKFKRWSEDWRPRIEQAFNG